MQNFAFQPPHALPMWAHALPLPIAPWCEIAFHYDGEREIPGPKNNPDFMALMDFSDGKQDGKILGAQDDDEAYCAKGHCAAYELAGVVSPRSAWARSFSTWGQPLPALALYCTAVLERGPNMGHVTWPVGRTAAGNFIGFGFNQSDGAVLSEFDPKRIIAIRWAPGVPLPKAIGFNTLPVVTLTGHQLSTNER